MTDHVLYTENCERLSQYNIDPARFRPRFRTGISAFVRLRNEDDFMEPSITSILSLCDEIVLCVQGEQNDRTAEIALDLARRHESVRIAFYPFLSVPNGPGHDQQKKGSVHERAYFYNWCMAQTNRQWVLKWDGDMVLWPEAESWLRDAILAVQGHDAVSFYGDELVGPEANHFSTVPETSSEPRLFMVAKRTFYFTSFRTQNIDRRWRNQKTIDHPAFVHLKWVKPHEKRIDAWPKDISEPVQARHWERIRARQETGERFERDLPPILVAHMDGRHE